MRNIQALLAKAKTSEQQLEQGLKLWQDLEQKAKVVESWIAEAESIINEEATIAQSIAKHKVDCHYIIRIVVMYNYEMWE